MATAFINHIDDPRIAAYRELRDKSLAARHGLFVAEGEHLVRRLLESDYQTHSLLISESRLPHVSTMTGDTPIYVAPADVLSDIVGFQFHRGLIALGVRRPLPSLNALLTHSREIRRLVVCPEINDVENLGGIMRTAAAFGFNNLLLGESCCDPLARRAIRTSMGAVFKLNIARSHSIIDDLQTLKSEHHFQLHATTPALSGSLPQPAHKTAILFGSEAFGLPHPILEFCDAHATIPMATGVDSLNIVVAAGIILNHYRENA